MRALSAGSIGMGTDRYLLQFGCSERYGKKANKKDNPLSCKHCLLARPVLLLEPGSPQQQLDMGSLVCLSFRLDSFLHKGGDIFGKSRVLVVIWKARMCLALPHRSKGTVQLMWVGRKDRILG